MENHANQLEAWLVILKRHSTQEGIHYEEAVEEAICFGWIDGVMKSAAPEYYYLRFSPRKRGSIWAVANQRRVEKMSALGKMTEAGMEKVREARENGEWTAAIEREDPSLLPDVLKLALDQDPEAREGLEKFTGSRKKQLVYWINSAKTEKTRRKRVEEILTLTKSGEK